MAITHSVEHNFERECNAAGDAPRLAAVAALLEMGDRLGILKFIEAGREFSVNQVAYAEDLPEVSVANYLEALQAAAVIRPVNGQGGLFEPAPDFDQIRHQAGFISWTMNANRPFIENAREFLADPSRGSGVDLRDGREVAVTSQWMGSTAFYPAALATILDRKPTVAVDLGSGTCRLLIEILLNLPQSRAVGLDLSHGACQEAASAAEHAGVSDRLRIIERPIQAIAVDPEPLQDAQVIHAGFVFHDMMPDEENVADQVLANCCASLQPGGLMAITEAVPYVRNERERHFSAIVTYYHQQFMKRRLLNESEWMEKLRNAGFVNVRSVELAFPTGRLFLASKSRA
jgi:SAM-dependent methyltransferase